MHQVFYNGISALRFRLQLELTRRRIKNDPAAATYTDLALSAVEGDLDDNKLELFQNGDAARYAAEQARLKAIAIRRAEERSAL